MMDQYSTFLLLSNGQDAPLVNVMRPAAEWQTRALVVIATRRYTRAVLGQRTRPLMAG
jgi:hypothetical protein